MYRSQLLILMIKKSLLNIGIIVYVGIFLISINLFENNSSFTLSSGVQFVYAQDNRGGDGDGNGGSKGDGDGNGGSKGDGDGGDNNRNNDSKESGGNNKKNKSIVKDDNNIGQEILIVGEKSTCPTQSESVELSGIINPKGIRLLGDFYPCKIADGGVTLNIPEIPILKLAVMYIDYNGNNHAGALITPAKIQSIGENQGLFVIELDKNMKGINPITGQSTILTKINGLALYNNGDKPVVFKPGNIAALTATFTK